MKQLKITSQFKKDLKKYQNQPQRIQKLKVVLGHLEREEIIPAEYKPHKLLGNYKDCMECHIESDTLLIWIDEEIIKLLRLGTHSELFRQKHLIAPRNRCHPQPDHSAAEVALLEVLYDSRFMTTAPL